MTYSGLIGLVIGSSTIFTGLIFLLIVTRTLSPEELGTWSLIGGLLTYVIIIEPMISYWTTREIARGVESGKTAVVSSGLFSVVGILAYIIIAYVVSEPTATDVNVLYFAALMIPFIFLNRTFSAIALGWKPHVNSIGVLIFDIAKIPAALFFMISMDYGIEGAILSLVIGYVVSDIILAILCRSQIQKRINKDYLEKWLKLAWLPSYIKFPNMIVLDVLIFSVLTGSVVGLAYWTAAYTVGTAVRHTSQITRAVYPKLLSGGQKEYLQENLIRLFYFAFPFLAISIFFAKPVLFALNPLYDVAAVAVIFIAIRAFLKILASSFTQALQGIEDVDKNQNSTQKDFIKSKLFYLPTIRLIHRGVYLGTLGIGLYLFIQYGTSQLDLVVYWSIIAMIIQIPFTTYFYLLTRKNFPVSVDPITIMKYLVISILVFGGTYLLTEEFLEYNESIFVFLPNLIPFVLFSIFVYLGLTYVFDKRTRKLFKAVISEIKPH